MPINGSAELIEDKITYNPDPDYIGTDIINYSITDGNGGEDTGKMIIRVNPEAETSFPYPPDTSIPGAVWLVPQIQSVAADSDFSIELHLNSGNQSFAGYYIEGIYDSSIMLCRNYTVGLDGFLSGSNPSDPGIFRFAGFDAAGKSPGTDLHILTINFETYDAGISDIIIKVYDIIDITYQEIGNPAAYNGKVYVDSPTPNPTPGPERPVAVDDNATTNQNKRVTISVLSNDYDPDGDPISLLNAGSPVAPLNGTIEISISNIIYTPNTDFTGTDSFSYTITDMRQSDTGMVNVTVNPINTTPVCNPALCGDANCDGLANILDALLTAQYYVGSRFLDDYWAADVNCDGTITIIDALIIARYYVGILQELNCCAVD